MQRSSDIGGEYNMNETVQNLPPAARKQPIVSYSAPVPVVADTAVVCGTSIAHLLEARDTGYLHSIPEWQFFYPERINKNGEIPGLATPEVLCYIDIELASEGGITFVLDADGGECHLRMSSTGIDGIPFDAVRRVIDNRPQYRGAIRYLNASDPSMAHMHKSGLADKKVWHATYWSRVITIQEDGLVANKRNDFGLALGEHVHLGLGEGTERWKGLVRRPDVMIEIDPTDLSDAITLIPDQLDTVLVKGGVTPNAFRGIEPIVPRDMPEDLKGNVVNFTEIPIIDFSIPEAEIIEALRHAISVGFMQITNHGIPDELCKKCVHVAQKLFSLPQEAKNRLKMPEGGGSSRGYFGKGAENTDGLLNEETQGPKGGLHMKRVDCKEGWDMKGCKGDGGGAITAAGASFTVENPVWPDDELPELRAIVAEYQELALAFGRRILLYLGKALDLPDPEVFVRSTEKPVVTHRLLHYWPLENLKNEISIGAHCDYGLLTVLLQDKTGGLQVLNSDKVWVHCPPVEGALVCNFGDMLARWTQNRCPSTIHRVVNISDVDRYSMPFFIEPSFSTVLDPNSIGIPSSEKPQTCEEVITDFYTRAGLFKAP